MARQTLLILFFLILYTGAFALSVATAHQTDMEVEYKIKAAFLLNFAKFINWPKEAFSDNRQTFKICVLGHDPFDPTMAGIESHSIDNRDIILYRTDRVDQTRDCHLLFISSSETNNLQTIHGTLADHSIITVSDINDFARSGGIIEFIRKGNKLTFKINLKQARKKGLNIDSSLLNLATEVIH